MCENYEREVKLSTCLAGRWGIKDELTLAEAVEWENGLLSTVIEVCPGEKATKLFWLNLNGEGAFVCLLALLMKGSGGL